MHIQKGQRPIEASASAKSPDLCEVSERRQQKRDTAQRSAKKRADKSGHIISGVVLKVNLFLAAVAVVFR